MSSNTIVSMKRGGNVREELMAEIASLKKENEELKKDREELFVYKEADTIMTHEIEDLHEEIKVLKQKESVVDEVFEGLKKNEKEYIHRNNILQRENDKMKQELILLRGCVYGDEDYEGLKCGCGLTDNCDHEQFGYCGED